MHYPEQLCRRCGTPVNPAGTPHAGRCPKCYVPMTLGAGLWMGVKVVLLGIVCLLGIGAVLLAIVYAGCMYLAHQ